MPIEPIDPSKKVGDGGSDKYNPPKEKFGPSEYDKVAEKVKQENEKAKAEAHKMAEAHRAKTEAERPRTYTERLQDMGRLPKPSGGGSSGIKSMKYEPKTFKSGGKVSKTAMKKAGFYDKDKTQHERQNIIKKVTTKPQRVAIVEKVLLGKKMNKGGSVASKRADGIAIRGRTKI